MKIAVLPDDAQLDVATMTLISLNQQMNKMGKSMESSLSTMETFNDNSDEDDSGGSDEEFEIGGDVMKRHFEHFTNVIAPNRAVQAAAT